MQYTETELAKLIETVEKEFTTHLNKAEEAHSVALAKSEVSASGTLAKAEDSAPPKKDKESKGPEKKEAKAPESKESAPKEGEGEAAPAAEGKPEGEAAAPAAAAPAEGEAAPAPAAAAPAGHGYDEEDMAHMLKMYQSMSREELLAHHDCVRQCLDSMGAEQAPAAPGAEMAPAEAAPAAPAAPGAEMGKSEIKDENPVLNSKPTDKGSNTNASYNKNTGGKVSATGAPTKSPGAKSPASKVEGVQMNKSENAEVELIKSELEAEKAKNTDLQKNFDKATEVLAALVKKVVPQGKAITSLDVVAKSEDTQETQLSKSEIKDALMKKASDPTLTKADRDAINSFYLGGSNFNTISHLLKN